MDTITKDRLLLKMAIYKLAEKALRDSESDVLNPDLKTLMTHTNALGARLQEVVEDYIAFHIAEPVGR